MNTERVKLYGVQFQATLVLKVDHQGVKSKEPNDVLAKKMTARGAYIYKKLWYLQLYTDFAPTMMLRPQGGVCHSSGFGVVAVESSPSKGVSLAMAPSPFGLAPSSFDGRGRQS